MYTRWKEPPSKSKNRWDIITENKLEAMIRIREKGHRIKLLLEGTLENTTIES
jgi:hypothetical protein